MNSPFSLFDSWPLLTLLAIEAAVVIGFAFLLQFCIRSAPWRRTLWQTCLLTLLCLAFIEISGAGRLLANWPAAQWFQSAPALLPPSDELAGDERAAEPIRVQSEHFLALPDSPPNSPLPLLPSRPFESIPTDQAHTLPGNSSPRSPLPLLPPMEENAGERRPAETILHPGNSAWPYWIWFAGTMLLLARAWCGRLIHFLIRSQSTPVRDPELLQRAKKLARQLGLRRSIRLIQSPRFSTPFAFGLLRPTVGLPQDFAEKFPGPRQAVILAHELSHLSARDPAWDLVADSALAFFFWHPLAWWARAQFRKATETAADEASLLVANGPNILAECLVELGARLVPSRSLGSIRMAGFRSGLGQRVEKLVKLNHHSWRPPGRLPSALVKLFLPFAVTAMALLSTAWTLPQTLNTGEETMNPIKTYEQFTGVKKNFWKTTLTALGLAASLPIETAAQKEFSPAELPATLKTNSASVHLAQQTTERPAGRNPFAGRPADSQVPIQAKLQQIRLEQVRYDGIPLGEVLRDLQNISQELDPEGRGINFIISNLGHAPAGVDPFAAAPSGPKRSPVDLNDIIIRVDFPLRHVSLRDVLNALARTAEHPIHYTVEDYGVVFAYGRGPQPDRNLDEQFQQLSADLLQAKNQERQRLIRFSPGHPQVIKVRDQIAGIERLKQELGSSITDPVSAARYGITMPGQSTASPYMMDPEMARRYGLPIEPRMAPDAPTPPKEEALLSKLNRIRFDEVAFDGLPLSEVVRDLIEQSRHRDPEGEGVNFLISPLPVHEPFQQFDPFTGAPLPSASSLNLHDVIVRLLPPLRNVRLKNILDAITKVAEHPLEYSIEEYAVVFTPGAQVHQPVPQVMPAPLDARTFRVEPDKFLPGLEKTFGISLPADPAPDQIQTALRHLLSKLGIKDIANKSVFYNDLTGVIFVRAAPDDWPVIEAAFETLGGSGGRTGGR